MTRIIILIIIALNISSCATKKKPEPSAERSYIKAKELLDTAQYKLAAEEFAKIDEEHPFTYWGKKGQIMAAYSYFRSKSYADSNRVIDNYFNFYPNDENLPYLQYLKSRSFYDRIPNTKRSQEFSKLAIENFSTLIIKYPHTKYTQDARGKVKNANESIAGNLMDNGRFFQRKGDYMAAIDKFKQVTLRYHNTRYAPEAYYRIAETYHKIGIDNQSKTALAMLKSQYPDNKFTKLSTKKIKF